MIDLPKHLSIVSAKPPCWRVIAVRYFDANKGEGNNSANIYIRTQYQDVTPAYVNTRQSWPDGQAFKVTEYHDTTQIDGDPPNGTVYTGCDFVMSHDGYRPTPDAPGPYALMVFDSTPSDVISGFGLAPNRAHDTYRVEFQYVQDDEPEPPTPPPSNEYVTRDDLAEVLRTIGDTLDELVAKFT